MKKSEPTRLKAPDIPVEIVELFELELGIVSGVVVTRESTLREDLGCDSLDLVELIMALEEHFRIELGDAENSVTGETTVGQLLNLFDVKIDQRRSRKVASGQ